MADNMQTSTLPRELKNTPAKNKVDINFLKMEGVGLELLDNELFDGQAPSFETKEPRKDTAISSFTGSISFTEPQLGHVAANSAQETVVKLAEKTAEVVSANAKDIVDAGSELLRYIISTPEKVSYTTVNSMPSPNIENTPQTGSNTVNTELVIKQRNSFFETINTAQHLARQEETLNIALRITDKSHFTEEDATLLNLNANYADNLKNISSAISLEAEMSEMRRNQMIQARAESIQETKGQGVNLDTNKIAEGGSVLSQTGGAGAG